jgi:hypothetical protein
MLAGSEPVYRLLRKFHAETDCGKDGRHWAECEAACQAFLYDDWQEWVADERER